MNFNESTLQDIARYMPIDIFYKQIDKNIKLFLNKETDDSQEKKVIEILKSYKDSSTSGDHESRKVMKQHIRNVLLKGFSLYNIDLVQNTALIKDQVLYNDVSLSDYPDLIDNIIPFEQPSMLTPMEKFEILLFKFYSLGDNGRDTSFNKLVNKYPYFVKMRKNSDYSSIDYLYDENDIEKMYAEENIALSFNDKIEVLTQRVYEEVYGLKCLDILAYCDVNEVGFSSGGNYIYCWSDFKYHLSFLSLSVEQARIAQEKAISFDKSVKNLDYTNPEVLCHRADDARITATQEPYTSARNLCIRIFNKSNVSFLDLEQNAKIKALTIALIKSGFFLALQGGMGTGKTTFMKVLFDILDDHLHIGLVEDYFEQHIMKMYPYKRIVEIQAINNKNILDTVKTILRMSIDVAGLGESRDGDTLYAFLQLVQSVSIGAWFTTHANKPEITIPRLKNLLMGVGRYTTEQAAVMDLIHNINFIYQFEMINNTRLITQIVEIVPLVETSYSGDDISIDTDIETLQKHYYLHQIQSNPSNMYRLNKILDSKDGKVKFVNYPSKRTIDKARNNPNPSAWAYMEALLKLIREDVGQDVPI